MYYKKIDTECVFNNFFSAKRKYHFGNKDKKIHLLQKQTSAEIFI